MNRTITTICCSCLLGVASLAGAQDKMAKDMTKDIKVTGCVAAGTEADHFMLNDATMAGDMKKEGAAAPMSYALMGGTLKPHVGHKVEVTGKWAEAAKPHSMSADKPAAPAGEMAKPMAEAHAIKVTSVKMVSPTCGT